MTGSKWMPVLFAGGLVCAVCALAQTGGGATQSPTTVTYDSSMPDSPFVGAWDGDQPDCSDPHAETECWKCEQSASGNSAFPVPKYWYETEVTCPKLEIQEKTHDECVCELEGTKKTVKVQATADTTDGKWRYVPKGEPGCGKDGPDNPIKFKEIKWAWKTIGRPGGDLMDKGDLATFDYVVPNGDVNISVVFKAKGVPDYAQCLELTDGPRTVGIIKGNGVDKYVIPRDWSYPVPQYAPDLQTGDGKGALGLLSNTSLYDLMTYEPVCSSSGCTKYQIRGQYYLSADITIRSCTTVTATGCSKNVGECMGVDNKYMSGAEVHEKKHYDIYRELVNTWNDKIEDAGLFQRPEDARAKISELRKSFRNERKKVEKRQMSHCPDFAGEVIWGVDGCGKISFVWIYVCP